MKLPPSPAKSMPAASKMDVPLGKVMPIRNHDMSSSITYLERKSSYCADVVMAREEQGESM